MLLFGTRSNPAHRLVGAQVQQSKQDFSEGTLMEGMDSLLVSEIFAVKP